MPEYISKGGNWTKINPTINIEKPVSKPVQSKPTIKVIPVSELSPEIKTEVKVDVVEGVAEVKPKRRSSPRARVKKPE